MDEYAGYQSPLSGRYASPQMQEIWSQRRKIVTWRRLWLALAESQQELGIDITDEQIDEIRNNIDNIDFDAASNYERELRHDVMAHIHALGDVAPTARPIIHLGATSQFVNCNTEILQLKDATQLIANKLARVICNLGLFAKKYRDLPTVGFTHYQPAQPTTVGKRATLWAQDFALTLEDLEFRLSTLRFRGVRGATGTQASFLDLFNGNHAKVLKLDTLVTDKMNWSTEKQFSVTGQTYPRIVDAQILSSIASVAAVAHKFATDVRLLANRGELEEPFEKKQIGSSAMAYKRNPMRCERVCALARFVMNMPPNALQTASVQWMERTLDDSANRRLTLPESFLSLDGLLDVLINISQGLIVHEKMVQSNLQNEMPFLATERLMMEAVKNGADRQDAHEVVRTHAIEVARQIKEDGVPNCLLKRLSTEQMFQGIDLDMAVDPSGFIGRAPEQVDSFCDEIIEPIAKRYTSKKVEIAELKV
ncbi:MAG: adenylosuccinate lyase [Phycisphaerales bacterium]|jgi:adenylosuccinate lyase|nr:adenylosuccinate lyase [Phycisphaerales bacterium]